MLYTPLLLCYNADMKDYIDAFKNPTVAIEKYLDEFQFSYKVNTPKPGETNIPRHVHPYYELMFIDGGEVEFMVENRRYILKKGDVLIIKPAEYHYARRLFDVPYARYCIAFSPEFTFDKNFTEELLGKGEKFTVTENSAFARLARILKERAESGGEHEEVFFSSIINAMLLSLNGAKAENEEAVSAESNFQKIIGYVTLHLTEIKSVDDVANALFFSKSYIMHLFKSELHIGIMQYVRNKKILLAHQKIKNGEKPTEVYLKCGFSNYPSFYRAYFSYFGSSPKNAKNIEQKTEQE